MPGDFPLHVRDRDGTIHGITVPSDGTVEAIFDELRDVVDVEGSSLMFNDELLNEDDEIAETGVGCEDMLDLVAKPIKLRWELFEGDKTVAGFMEDNTVILNKCSGTKNWDAHTTPLLPLRPTGTSFSFLAQCMYDPSWTTSIGVTAEGVRAGRGSEEMAQVSIGEKGAVHWESEKLRDYLIKKGSILEFVVDSYAYTPKDENRHVTVHVFVHHNGERIHGKTSSFLTTSNNIMLSCYCYVPDQGWRIIN